MVGNISTFRVGIMVRFKIRIMFRVRVRVKDRVRVGMVLGLECGSLHQYNGRAWVELFPLGPASLPQVVVCTILTDN